MAKSDSVPDAGFKIQVNLTLASGQVAVSQISKNISRSTDKGFFLVAPFLDNTPTLPDGVTAGTFLEAGEELSFIDGSVRFLQSIIARRASDDQIVIEADMHEIPKQGTGITVTLPATLFRFYDGSGFNTTAAGGAYADLIIDGHIIKFVWTETNIGLGLNGGPLAVFIQGTGGKITIT